MGNEFRIFRLPRKLPDYIGQDFINVKIRMVDIVKIDNPPYENAVFSLVKSADYYDEKLKYIAMSDDEIFFIE